MVTGTWTWEVIWLSLLYACGPTSVLFGKHIDKIDQDAAKQVHTLPVLLGEAQARRWVQVMVCLQYAGCIALVASGQEHWSLLIVLFNLPALRRLLQSYQQTKPDQAPAAYPDHIWPLWFSAFAFDHTRRFTSLFIAALLIAQLLG